MSFDEQPDAPLHDECANEIANLTVQLTEMTRIAMLNKQLAETLLDRLAESQAREGILRDTISVNDEWHRENLTYPEDGCDDLSGLLDMNTAALNMPLDDTALKIVLTNRMAQSTEVAVRVSEGQTFLG